MSEHQTRLAELRAWKAEQDAHKTHHTKLWLELEVLSQHDTSVYMKENHLLWTTCVMILLGLFWLFVVPRIKTKFSRET